MSRMYDRILANGVRLLPGIRPFLELNPDDQSETELGLAGFVSELARSGVIVVAADNVAEYFYGCPDSETWSDITEFPNLAPPFASAFVEYAMPPQTLRATGSPVVIDRSFCGSRRGAFVQTMPAAEFARLPFSADRKVPADAKWAQCATIFVEFGKGDISLIGSLGWCLREDGSMIDPGRDNWYPIVFGIPIFGRARGEEDADLLAKELQDVFMWPTAFVAALTYSFIHCRNTVLVDRSPEPKLAKAAERRGRKLVTYKVLEIEPVKRILAEKGQAEKNGLKLALHICRGCFKDYRERGLFGKVKGLFWFDMHVRGSLSEGVVVKDYAAPAKADEDVA